MKTLKFRKFKNTLPDYTAERDNPGIYFFQYILYYSDILTENFIFKYEIYQWIVKATRQLQ